MPVGAFTEYYLPDKQKHWTNHNTPRAIKRRKRRRGKR